MIELAIALIVCTAIIMGGLAFMQMERHKYFINLREIKDTETLNQTLQDKIEEFEEYKGKIDSLMLKSGFRL